MHEKPKSVREPILTRLGLSLIGVISITSAIAALLIFGYYFMEHGDAAEGRSLVFASFAVNSMVYIFAYRSMRLSLFHMSPLSQNKPLILAVLSGLALVGVAFAVPPIRELLGIVPLSLEQWVLIGCVALFLLAVVEVGKWVSNRLHNQHA